MSREKRSHGTLYSVQCGSVTLSCIYATVRTFLGVPVVSIRKNYIIFLYELENATDFWIEHLSILSVTFEITTIGYFLVKNTLKILLHFVCFKPTEILSLSCNEKTFHYLVYHSSHIKQGTLSICLIRQSQKSPPIFRTKKIQDDCTNLFPWNKRLHSTVSC